MTVIVKLYVHFEDGNGSTRIGNIKTQPQTWNNCSKGELKINLKWMVFYVHFILDIKILNGTLT